MEQISQQDSFQTIKRLTITRKERFNDPHLTAEISNYLQKLVDGKYHDELSKDERDYVWRSVKHNLSSKTVNLLSIIAGNKTDSDQVKTIFKRKALDILESFDPNQAILSANPFEKEKRLTQEQIDQLVNNLIPDQPQDEFTEPLCVALKLIKYTSKQYRETIDPLLKETDQRISKNITGNNILIRLISSEAKSELPNSYDVATKTIESGITYHALDICENLEQIDPEFTSRHIRKLATFTNAASRILSSIEQYPELQKEPWFDEVITLCTKTLETQICAEERADHPEDKLQKKLRFYRNVNLAINTISRLIESPLKDFLHNQAIKLTQSYAKSIFLSERVKNEGLVIEKNPDRVNINQSVSNAINTYNENHPDNPAHFSKSDHYIESKEWFDIFHRPVTYPDLINLRTIINPSKELVGQDLGMIIVSALKNGVSVMEVIYSIKSFLPRNAENTITTALISEEPTQAVETPRELSLLEAIESQPDGTIPLTLEKLLYLSLEVNQGDINLSLSTLRNIFKIQSRGQQFYTDSGLWFKKYIKDEYSYYGSFNEMDLGEPIYTGKLKDKLYEILPVFRVLDNDGKDNIDFDLSFPNRIGLPYHAIHIIELLSDFPPEVITFLTMGEYINFGPRHGLIKFISDLELLSQTSKIKKTLEKHTPFDTGQKMPTS